MQCQQPWLLSRPGFLSAYLVVYTSLRWFTGEGNGTPLQCSCLENPMDGGAWEAAVYGVTKSRTRLSNFNFTFHFPVLEKEMATQSSVLAWRIPETGEAGGLLSTGSHRVGHDWSDLAAAAAILRMFREAWTSLSLHTQQTEIFYFQNCKSCTCSM